MSFSDFKSRPLFFVVVGVCLTVLTWMPVAQGEILPTEAFFSGNQYTKVTLSPDGEYLAFLNLVNGGQNLFSYDIGKIKYRSLTEGDIDRIFDYAWAGPDYLVYQVSQKEYWGLGLAAIRRDGRKRNKKILREPARLVNALPDRPNQVLVVMHPYKKQFADIHKIGVTSKTRSTYFDNPGDVDYWLMDREHRVRLVKVFNHNNGDETYYRYRKNLGDPWTDVTLPEDTYPLSLGYDDNLLYVATGMDRQFMAVYKYDLDAKDFSGLVWKDSEYDVVPGYDLNGVSEYKGLIFSDRFRSLAGLSYERNGPQVRWFLPFYEDIQEMLDESFPNTQNVILGRDRREEKFLIFAYSDRDPGNYYILDQPKRRLRWLFSRNPSIDPEKMLPMKPVQFPSRDGHTLHGYLTLPKGGKDNLPLVIKPHGGPFTRDKWGFDPEVQYLANRGYAVLQVNYRGSTGYGKEFFTAAFAQIGKEMQNDITDAVLWAIDEKVADPARVAIFGQGFGGYLAISGMVFTPHLFKCAITVGGISDWAEFLKSGDIPEIEQGRPLSRNWFGENPEENGLFQEISPVHHAGRAGGPILLIPRTGKSLTEDTQTRLFAEALENAGKPYEVFEETTESVDPLDKMTIADRYNRIASFIAENL